MGKGGGCENGLLETNGSWKDQTNRRDETRNELDCRYDGGHLTWRQLSAMLGTGGLGEADNQHYRRVHLLGIIILKRVIWKKFGQTKSGKEGKLKKVLVSAFLLILGFERAIFASEATIDRILRLTCYTSGSIVALGTIIGFILAWRRGWLRHLRPFTTMAKTVNNFVARMLPGLLDKFEEKGLAPSGALRQWTSIMSEDILSSNSPKQLNEKGEKLLEESGIKDIIEDHIDNFIEGLEKERLKTAHDIELRSFYLLKESENTDIAIPLKKYLYDNPHGDINTILLAGSIYLRNKYLEKHPELLEKKSTLGIPSPG